LWKKKYRRNKPQKLVEPNDIPIGAKLVSTEESTKFKPGGESISGNPNRRRSE
jgi:hypothetical protein